MNDRGVGDGTFQSALVSRDGENPIKDADENAQSGQYGSALQAAAAKGHEHIVRLLLNKGAEVATQGRYNGNALQAAAVGGYNPLCGCCWKRVWSGCERRKVWNRIARGVV